MEFSTVRQLGVVQVFFFPETVDLCFIRKHFVLFFGQWCLHCSRLMSGCTVGQLFLGPKNFFFQYPCKIFSLKFNSLT